MGESSDKLSGSHGAVSVELSEMSEKLGNLINPTRTMCHRTLFVGFFCLIGATLCAAHANWHAAAPVPNKDVAVMMGTIIGYIAAFVAIVVWISLIFVARRMDRDLDSYRAGNFLYHFTYSRDQWEAFIATEKKLESKNALIVAAIIAGSGIIVGIAVGAGFGGPGQYAVGTIAVLAMLGIAAIVWFGASALANSHIRRRLENGGNAIIAADSAYCSGEWQFWNTRIRRLVAVDIKKDPMPILQFTIILTSGVVGEAMQLTALPSGRIVPTRFIKYIRIPLPPNIDPTTILADLKTRLTA